ncbi:TetR/AcrR family transcriptional regulator [Streptomyces sp. NPDC001255]|uniref:TetR/AcrR family transcriptional regulator n=1 Tax=Streptomyces sp. NPDC001255 TaxID=3364550 RepID=UPI003693E1E7
MAERRRRVRWDAEANRARIVAAAREVFAERGPQAPFSAVAARAGVANATLYRHFANAQELCTAVFSTRLEESRVFLTGLEEEEDPWRAFARFVEWIAETPDAALMDVIMDDQGQPPEIVARREEVRAQVRRLCARAEAAGSVRPGLGPRDIDVVIYALTRVGVEPKIGAEDRRRFTSLVLDGLRRH